MRLPRSAPSCTVGISLDDYSNARGSEHSQFVQLGRQVGRGKDSLYLRYDRIQNFGVQEQALSVGSYWLPQPSLLLHIEAGSAVGDHQFRPKQTLNVQADGLAHARIQPLLGYRQARYREGMARTYTPGLRFNLPQLQAELRYGQTRTRMAARRPCPPPNCWARCGC
jgi:YaiO family outer membrane protein